MNENLKQFTDQLAAELKARLSSNAVEEFVKQVKASGDDRTFEVVMSTADPDRQGDELDQDGWDLTYFKMNPVVLWAHNYSSFPIGIVTDIQIQGDKTVASGKFAPAGLNPEADITAALYQEGIVKAVSPGYIQNDDGTRELLEVSFCPVPAGRYALSLRQVQNIGLSKRELVTKGFLYTTKAAKPGDTCQLDDGSPGELAQDPDNPGELHCVPAKDAKSNENSGDMNNELIKNLQAEHDRHGKALHKAIDEFGTGDDPGKAIEELAEKSAAEHDAHLEKCMKAIDDNYQLEDQKKSIDEFKAAFQSEHQNHVKCFGKAFDEFTKNLSSAHEEFSKEIDDFKSALNTELDRHEKAQMDLCKDEMGEGENDGKSQKAQKGAVAEELQEDQVLQQKYQRINNAYSVFDAFISAYLDESAGVDDYDKLLDEAVALMKDTETKSFPDSKIRPLIGKAGREISAKNKEKIKAVIKAIEEFKADAASAHDKHSQTVIAALKDLMGPDAGNEGEEQKPQKTATAPKTKVEVRDISRPVDAFEAYMFGRQVLRKVDSVIGEGLEQLNKKFKLSFPDRR